MKKIQLPTKISLICLNLCAWLLCVGTCISANNISSTYERVKNDKLISNGLDAISDSIHIPLIFCIADIIFLTIYLIIRHIRNKKAKNKQSITGTDISCLIACAVSAIILIGTIGGMFFSTFFGTLKTLS